MARALPQSRKVWLRRAKVHLRKLLLPEEKLLFRSNTRISRDLPEGILGRTNFPELPTPFTQIVISHRIRSGSLALATLLHELIHTTTPLKCPDHGRLFIKPAPRLGFRSPSASPFFLPPIANPATR